jgi:hypothetical protein
LKLLDLSDFMKIVAIKTHSGYSNMLHEKLRLIKIKLCPTKPKLNQQIVVLMIF